MNNKHVMVYIEQRQKEIQNVSLELLGIGRQLAEKLGTKLDAVIIGSDMSSLVSEVSYYGPDNIYVIDNEILGHYVTEPYTKALAAIIKDTKPDVCLIGATSLGRDLAPRVSSRVHTGLTADCTQLDIDEETKNLLMTRPAFGGNLMATIVCPDHRPQMSSVRPGVMVKPLRDTSLKANVIDYKLDFNPSDLNVEVLETVYEQHHKIKIEDANALVSAGRGVGSKENMTPLYQLAELLKGEVSGSRPVIENGWLDKDRQVGQTGKTVRPNLYFACGISGAIQHTSGMEESDLIIAINKNPEAPIFEVADVGIVGDVKKIVPELIKQLSK